MTEESGPSDAVMARIAESLATSDDPEWAELQRIVRGELTSGELAALRAKSCDEPELNTAVEAYWPLSDAERERVVQRLLGPPSWQRGASRGPTTRRRNLILLASTLPALAVGIVVFSRSQLPPPQYRLEAWDATSLRGTPAGYAVVDGTLVWQRDQQVTLLLHPLTKHEQQVGVKAWVGAHDAPLRAISLKFGAADSGALRLTIDTSKLLNNDRLVLLVGTQLDAESAEGGPAEGPGWQRFELHLRLAGRHVPEARGNEARGRSPR